MASEGESSEDDVDFHPSEIEPNGPSGSEKKRSRRGLAVATEAESDTVAGGRRRIGSSEVGQVDPLAQLRDTAKKAKINAIWEQMKGGSSVQKPVKNGHVSLHLNGGPIRAAPTSAHPSATPPAPTPLPAEPPTQPPSQSIAAAALAAVREAAQGNPAQHGKIKVVEVRDFAGQKVEVTRMVDPKSKEGQSVKQKADMKGNASNGLDAMLAQIKVKKKLNILDKSKKDWGEYKEDKGVVDELETFKKSGETYTEKMAFLSKADFREYETERDARLAAQARKS